MVSERLGHGNPAFTIDTYQHVLPGMQAEAAYRRRPLTADSGECVRRSVRSVPELPVFRTHRNR